MVRGMFLFNYKKYHFQSQNISDIDILKHVAPEKSKYLHIKKNWKLEKWESTEELSGQFGLHLNSCSNIIHNYFIFFKLSLLNFPAFYFYYMQHV